MDVHMHTSIYCILKPVASPILLRSVSMVRSSPVWDVHVRDVHGVVLDTHLLPLRTQCVGPKKVPFDAFRLMSPRKLIECYMRPARCGCKEPS